MPPGRLLVLAALAGFVAGLSPAEALAHDLRLVVKLPPDSPGELVMEAGFDDDTPAEAARATVTTPDGRLVAEGKTDERGVCRLPRPGPGRYVAVVEAVGHRDSVEFEVVGAPGPATETFAGQRLDRTLGLALGVGGLLLASLGYAWLRGRRRVP
jgi:nickel transport protein